MDLCTGYCSWETLTLKSSYSMQKDKKDQKNQMSEIQQKLRIQTLTSIQRSRNGSYAFNRPLH